ncbi:MAG: hypothetical protein AAGH67_05905, partial [Cyanobacteria bacterium P01_H01_bin.162]
MRGGKATTQYCEYRLAKNQQKLICRSLRTVHEIRHYGEHGFGENLRQDSVAMVHFNQGTRLKSVLQVIDQLTTEASRLKCSRTSESPTEPSWYSFEGELLAFLDNIYRKSAKGSAADRA